LLVEWNALLAFAVAPAGGGLGLLVAVEGHARALEDALLDEDRDLSADCERDGIARAGIDFERLAFLGENQLREEGLVGKVGYDHSVEGGAEGADGGAEQVVRQ